MKTTVYTKGECSYMQSNMYVQWNIHAKHENTANKRSAKTAKYKRICTYTIYN